MKESIIISIFILFIFIFCNLNKKNLVLIEANNSGYKFLVHNDKFKHESANILSEIITRMYKLKNHLVNNKNKFDDFKDSIDLLEHNLNENRTKIYENAPTSTYTSYSVNKGEEVVFCLKSKKTGELHKINLLTYVAIHEMSHIGCHEIGHTKLFKKIFQFYASEAVKIGIYEYENYDSNPVEYCGMVLSSTVL